MYIERILDGKEYKIELTHQELVSAYKELEHAYDVQDIKNNLKAYLNAKDYKIYNDNESFIDDAAYAYRSFCDDDYGYDEPVWKAIEETLREYKE